MFIQVAPALISLCSALLLGVLSACATNAGNLTDSVKTPSTANSSETTDATPYLTLADFAEQLGYMTSLEARVLAIRDDEPLAMGALGSALVERNPNNLTGHYALTAFYQHLDAAEAMATHSLAFDKRQLAILATGDGSQERPYRVTSRAEAILTLTHDEKVIVGSIYQSNGPKPLQLLLLSRKDAASPVASSYFDLSVLVNAVSAGDEVNRENPRRCVFWRTTTTPPHARPLAPTWPASDVTSPPSVGWRWPAENPTCLPIRCWPESFGTSLV